MTNVLKLSSDDGLRPTWLTQKLFPFTSRLVEIDSARPHYVDEGSGPVLLFLRGAPNWSFFYREFIRDLCSDFRCVALEFPGFGLSPSDARSDGH